MRSLFSPKSVTIVCCAFLLLITSCSTTRDFTPVETNTFYAFNPEARVLINSPKELDQSKQTLLILYALPNGNSIEMTAGKKLQEGDDWHFDIQHIAAQVRFLRQTLKDYNITIAYLEATQKSWPAWRKKYEYKDTEVARILNYVRFETGNPENVILSGHSGGGSFINGFVNSSDSIPNFISRIVYLDANYSYDDSLEHGKKFINWLNADTTHKLCVIAYDDRDIVLNGKKVVSPTGGTYRATQRMLQRFTTQTEITTKQDSTLTKYFAFNNRARFIVHTNPDTLILHTVLVAKNGLIHSVLLQTELEEKNYLFFGEPVYSNLIAD